jgi:VCBS repeat-containing protein
MVVPAALPDRAIAEAPASIAGYSYRDMTNRSATFLYQDSAEFHTDGTYATRAWIVINPVLMRGDYGSLDAGTYSYSITGANQATITLNPTSGTQEVLTLTFSDGANGTVTRPRDNVMVNGPFSITPTAAIGATSLLNISSLVSVQPGIPATIGFIVAGTQLREFLIRCVGPSLSSFGVSNLAANPTYQLRAAGTAPTYEMPGAQQLLNIKVEPSTVGWSNNSQSTATLSAEAARVGAFPLALGSTDKADVWLLQPGAYTIVVSPTDSTTAGSCLVEVYEVP